MARQSGARRRNKGRRRSRQHSDRHGSQPQRHDRRVSESDQGAEGQNRRSAILAAVEQGDLRRLRALALGRGGLIDDQIRARAWPLLLNVRVQEKGRSRIKHGAKSQRSVRPAQHRSGGVEGKDDGEEELSAHQLQVRRDVDRSFGHVDIAHSMSPEARDRARAELEQVIRVVFERNPELHYYQGYHDVATLFMLVAGPRAAPHLLLQYSSLFLLEHHSADFEETIAQLSLLLPLLRLADRGVHDLLEETQAEHQVEPFFALPWLLTGFAHHFCSLAAVARIHDALLASHPMLCLYMCATAVLTPPVRSGLFTIPDPDMATIHGHLQALPQALQQTRNGRNESDESNENNSRTNGSNGSGNDGSTMDVDKLVADALELMHRFPPQMLVRVLRRRSNGNTKQQAIAAAARRQLGRMQERLTRANLAVEEPTAGSWALARETYDSWPKLVTSGGMALAVVVVACAVCAVRKCTGSGLGFVTP